MEESPVLIPVTELHAHPKNPRVSLREDVVQSIVASLGDSFDPAHSLIVRKTEEGYEVLAGHHRLEASKRKGIESVPCWVKDLSDEDAYMLLVTSNSQGELTPLEIGLHALHCEQLGKGGRGKKGGLSAYAERVGKGESYIRQVKQAAEVTVKSAVNCEVLHDKTQHLSAIHAMPEPCWPECVGVVLSELLSAKDTAERVKAAKDARTARRAFALFAEITSQRELDRIDQVATLVFDSLDGTPMQEEWVRWREETDPIDIKEVQAKRIEFEDRLAELNDTPPPEKPNLVLADPPWRYDFAETDNRQIENQYPSATVEEIISHCPSTESDCVLFLWATVAKLREALEVMEGWGFEYKTSAVWDKEKIGMGYWFRGQHELLLVGTKGSFSPPEQEQRVSSVFRESRGKHSKKPECVYAWLESAFPGAKKLEMYCRSPRPGWATFGNEAKEDAA